MTLEKLASAIGCEPRGPLSLEHIIRAEVEACAPLVAINGQKVEFVHQSAKDFLLGIDFRTNPSLQSFGLSADDAHFTIARRCLQSLRKDGLLGSYARRYWLDHAKKLSTLGERLVQQETAFSGRNSALREAWWADYPPKVRHGLSCDLPAPRRMLQLHMACLLSFLPWITSILSSIWEDDLVSLEARDSDGCTPLCYAVCSGNYQVTEMLLRRGSETNAMNTQGKAPLMIASPPFGRRQLVETVETNTVNYFAPLDYAKKAELLTRQNSSNNEAIVRLLLNNGADPNFRGHNTVTPLCQAVLRRDELVVRLLVQSGAEIDTAISKLPVAPVQVSVSMCPRSSLTIGVDHDPGLGFGCTALHIAVAQGSMDIVKLLIHCGAHLAITTRAGETALMVALRLNRLEIARILRTRGAQEPQTEATHRYMTFDPNRVAKAGVSRPSDIRRPGNL